jgi:hypothetical protein
MQFGRKGFPSGSTVDDRDKVIDPLLVEVLLSAGALTNGKYQPRS